MNENAPQLSIILPVRNAERVIAAAVSSCLAQSFRAFELIVIDDQSEDSTREQLAAFSGDARMRILSGKGGLVAALRLGCAQARGAFLGRMDADDISTPARFDTQLAFLDAHPDVAVCGCGVRIPNKSDSNAGMQSYVAWCNALLTPEDHRRERFVESPLVHPSVVMRRDAFEHVGGYADPAWAEDYDLWLQFLDHGYALAKVPDVLLEWTDGPDRLTRSHPRYTMDRFLQAKAAYLARLEVVRAHGVTICGAGPIGKRVARLLVEQGIEVHRFLEIHPRRVGSDIHGVPVCAQNTHSHDGSVLLSAVGQPGARDRVRTLVAPLGCVEGEDFFCLA